MLPASTSTSAGDEVDAVGELVELIDDLGGLRDRGGVEVGEQPLRVVAAQGAEFEDPVVLGRQGLDVDTQDGQA